jgi:plastocyanin
MARGRITRMRRSTPILTLALLVLGLAVAPAQAGHTATVTLKGVAFKPAKVTVRRGDSVRFVWDDGATTHNVTSRGALRFKGTGDRTKGSYRVAFRKRGTYRYVCTRHIGMAGRIVVR